MSSEYHIKIISLENCPYSQSAKELVKNYNINSKIIDITRDEKDKFKTNSIQTFPQIYLKKYNKVDDLLLGGYSDLSNFVNEFYKKPYSDDKVNDFMNKYKWSKKAVLRLIQLINIG